MTNFSKVNIDLSIIDGALCITHYPQTNPQLNITKLFSISVPEKQKVKKCPLRPKFLPLPTDNMGAILLYLNHFKIFPGVVCQQ